MDVRRVSALAAALANVVGIGLGYVYLGRIIYAFALLGVVVGTLAVAGWTRLVFVPEAIPALAIAALLIGLTPIVHCTVLAMREPEHPARSYNRWWFYVGWIVASFFVTDAIAALRPTLFGFEPFRLPAASMAPTLERGDFIMVDTWHYRRTEPAFGDLTVFEEPMSGVPYVKRVVGLPGDRIEVRDDVLIRNGQAVEEPYIRVAPNRNDSMRDFAPVVVPDDHYFMLGDNRRNSRDSRLFGAVSSEALHGRVVHRWFAWDNGVRWEQFPQYLE